MNSKVRKNNNSDFNVNKTKGGDKNLGIWTTTANYTGNIVEFRNRNSIECELISNVNNAVGSVITIELSYDDGATFYDYETIHYNHNGNFRHNLKTYATHIRIKYVNTTPTNSTGYAEVYFK
jgi:hypothetical protein